VTRARLGVALLWLATARCAGAVARAAPSSLRDYDILVPKQDSLDRSLAAALRRAGFSVRRRVRGGGRPAVAVISFRFWAPDSAATPWLHLRLADTRTGVIVLAVSAPEDSLGSGPEARGRALADSIATRAKSALRRTPFEP